jgi:hypothetical protein
MNQEVAQAIKVFFEDGIKAQMTFDMGTLYDYVQAMSSNPVTLKELSEAMNKLQQKGEILWVPVDGQQGVYMPMPPPNPQSTVFGAASGSARGAKRKAFTKKQKRAAFDELRTYPQLGPGLSRLLEWLNEQVYSQDALQTLSRH